MFLLQEAIAGGPLLLGAMLGFVILFLGLVLFLLYRKSNSPLNKETLSDNSDTKPAEKKKIDWVLWIVVIGVLTAAILLGNWLCNITYG